MFKLSTTLYGHDDDVKSLTFLDNNSIVSGSRDSTVRIWNRVDNGSKDFNSSIINYKSNRFVNSLAICRSSSRTLIASAGNENIIHLTGPDAIFTGINENNTFSLLGHTANVCCLDTHQNLLLSSSWDCTAKVWNIENGELLYDLKGHENSVWCAKFLDANQILTCGADRTIRKWVGTKQVKCFIAHDDVIRDLVLLPNGDFASCSNDLTIKIWDGATFQNKAILSGHQSFIYSLDILSNGDLVSCGEDRSIRVWRNNQCIQVITLPCISIWKILVLPNDDIVSASSDSVMRIFSRDAGRFATENETLKFQKEVENSSISESTLSSVNKESIPGIEALKSNEPKLEGDTKLIKSDANTIDLYQWTNNNWIKIGQMVQGSSSDKKQFYNGSYYDYVFNIDVEDGKPPLKLPVNINENPYEIAEKFLATYNLPYSYLQQIVDFIMANAQGISLDGNSAAANTNQGPKIIPQTTYLSFEKLDVIKFISAFQKLNNQQSVDNQVSDNLETLLNCEDYNRVHKVALDIIENWNDSSKLLGFDMLRAVITKIQPSEELFPILRRGLESTGTTPKIQMMTIRILVNTFKAKGWGEQVMLDEGIFDIIFTDYLFENLLKDQTFLPITVATLILNYAVLVNKFQLVKLHDKMLPIIRKLLTVSNILNNNEAAFRLLVSIGTLDYVKSIADKPLLVASFDNMEDERFVLLKKELE